MQIEIQCPVHSTLETIELPDNYRDFGGEVLCATPIPSRAGLGARLRVTIVDGKLISVERAGGAPRPFPPPEA
jgi:hypothetical protein